MIDDSHIALFYFSGTGNTEIIARLLGDEFKMRGICADAFKIETILSSPSRDLFFDDIEKYEHLGMGYPIHALNAPRIFFDFIKILPSIPTKNTFIFKCSGDPFLKGGSTSMVQTRLERKGYSVSYERLFVMPANVFISYPESLVKQLYDAACKKAKTMVEEILNGTRRLQENDWFLDIVSRAFSMLEGKGARYMGKDFRVSESCTLCGICIDNCPTGNIYRENTMIRFHSRCLLCLRCIYKCPENAISPRLFKFIVLKEGFNISSIISNGTIKGNFINENTKGFYKRFRSYLND